jgi:WD40 repeat protein
MNAQRQASLVSAIKADPLVSLRMDATAIADLAFGSMSVDVTKAEDRHLAMLSTESLELDLNDPAQRQFGDYELLELIGEGGMGVVYRAHQRSLDRDVAVKLLAAGPWASKNFIERFRHEAQNAARMQHPNIVAIYEVGSNEELHFFSMRLICGGSLADLLKREGKLSPLRAAQLLRTIAEAVDYAHRLGVLHLDLKPANVLLDDNGAPHVADFGLARRLEQGLAADNNEVSGTPSYMAPEQATAGAQKITPATDIWGLGAILYELVTGRPPYLGATPQATLKLVVEGKLTCPRDYTRNLPRDLQAIIEKCMAYCVADRYTSARALADDLAAFVEGRPVKARPLNLPQRVGRFCRREPRIAAMALLVLAALLIGLLATTQQWRRAEAQRHLAQEQTLLAQENAATSNARLWESRRNTALRLQADAKAFDALPALIANIDEQEKVGLSAAVERREVGMILSQGVTLIDRMIIADASPLTAELSPDGSLLAVGLNDISVRWYDTATFTERGRIDLLDQPTSDGTPRPPRLLRFVDDHRLLVTLDWFEYMVSPFNSDTILVDLDQAQVITPPPAFADFAHANYSADGRYAMLFNRDGNGQFWQVDPWRPLSDAGLVGAGQGSFVTPWLVGRGGKYALHLRNVRRGLAVSDPHNPRAQTDVGALSSMPITAWQESHDGATIALGDDDGHVYLVDLKTRGVRMLSAPSGSEATWIAFSEDDAWCAVARHDGDVYAFDTVSGNALHAGALQHDFELRHVALSHRNNLLIASGAGSTTLWRMPEQGPHGGSTEALRISANATRSTRAGLYWAGASLEAGLLATADMDGEVRLWRLPVDTALDAHTATLVTDRMPFDGERVPDVAYDLIRAAAVDRHNPSAPWQQLPQPPTVAEVVASGKSLVAVSGRRLYLFDAATMRTRYPPVELPGTPMNVAITADGSMILLGFGSNRPSGFELRLQTVDLVNGQMRPEHTTVQGPLRQLQFSPDGKCFVAIGPPGASTAVYDSVTLRPIGTYPHTPDRPVIWATFTADPADLWLVERSIDEADAENARLLRWDAQANQVREQRLVTGALPIGVTSVGGKALLATSDNIILDPGGPAEHTSAQLHGGEVTAIFAATVDQRLIAHAYARSVQLYDAATLDPIGPPLSANWRIFDSVERLAFDAQGEHLLARLGNSHRMIAWAVRADDRRVEELRRDTDLLAPAPRTRRVLRMTDAAEHAYLRGHDSGAWPPGDLRPTLAMSRNLAGAPVVSRDASTSPLLLDLTDHYTMTQFTVRKQTDTVLAGTGNLPSGVVTLDGIDYDIRGGVELRMPSSADGKARVTELQAKAVGIRVPTVPIAALHVLLLATFAEGEPNERTYANVRLHYRDGSAAVLPIRTQREVPGLTDHDRPTPIGWAINDFAAVGILPLQLFSNPRLANPHPERIIATLDLEASTQGWSEPVFVAVTAEPVIPSANSATSAQDDHKSGNR